MYSYRSFQLCTAELSLRGNQVFSIGGTSDTCIEKRSTHLPPVSSVTLLLQAEFLCDCVVFPRISFGFFLLRRTLFWYHFVIRIICCHLPLVDFETCSIKKIIIGITSLLRVFLQTNVIFVESTSVVLCLITTQEMT